MFLVLHNGRGVNGEEAPVFCYIAPTTATVTTTTQMTQYILVTLRNRKLHLCLGDTVYSV